MLSTPLCIIYCSMANMRLKSVLAPNQPPDSPPHEQPISRVAEDDSLVPIKITEPSPKKRTTDFGTGTPPSRNFQIRSFQTSRSFSQRWILLPPANPCTLPHSLHPPSSSSQTINKSSNQLILSEIAYKHNGDRSARMPYNNTAIPPPEEITGAACLPCKPPQSKWL